jgi:phosphoribosylglycinamide formyltransferase 1
VTALKNIAIFASGAGSNAQKIIDHFRQSEAVTVKIILCNKPGAGVLDIAARENIPSVIIEKEAFFRSEEYVQLLQRNNIDLIVLAGFLWKVPSNLVAAFPDKIINIHPALLPKFGGKGMYGNFVHTAVIEAGEAESGITIHFVNHHYDEGRIILQQRCTIDENDTPDTLAQKIHALEHKFYPAIVERLLT